MFNKIRNYLFGYVTIVIEGYFIEKFINICISKKVILSNMDRKKSTILHANIRITDFKKLKKIAKTTKCRVNILKKKGMPFVFNKYKKRRAFAYALITIIVLIFISSLFIWNIEIIGDTKISKEEIYDRLKEDGLSLGKLKYTIDKKEIINDIRLDRDDVAWMGINIKGTNAIIEIVDKVKKIEEINPEEYCDIIADKTGVITDIVVRNGTANIKVGDVVEKGSTLVSGWIEGKYTDTRYVHAEADIYAKTWYTEKSKIDLNQVIQERSSNTENKYTISINNFKINLYKKLTNFKNYDTIIFENKLRLFSNFYLPIGLTKQTNFELIDIEKTYTIEEAKDLGIQQLEEKLDSQIPNKDSIVNKQLNVYENEGNIDVELTYEILEKIGAKEKIVF